MPFDTAQRKAIAAEVDRRSHTRATDGPWGFVAEQFKQWPGLAVALAVLWWGSGFVTHTMDATTAANTRTIECYQGLGVRADAVAISTNED